MTRFSTTDRVHFTTDRVFCRDLRGEFRGMRRRVLFVLLLLAGGVSGLTAQTHDLAGDVPTLLQRGDSLLAAGRPVAALAMYRGAEQRATDPCQLAQAHTGIGVVHAASGNADPASEAWKQALRGLSACGAAPRERLALKLAQGYVQLHLEDDARAVVTLELRRQPQSVELKKMLARIAFIQGDWELAEAVSSEGLDLLTGGVDVAHLTLKDRRPFTELMHLRVTSHALAHHDLPDSLSAPYREALAALRTDEAQAYREEMHRVLAAEGMHLEALGVAREMLAATPGLEPAGYATAALRVAESARSAGRPMEALLAFHDATAAAERAGNPEVLAGIHRQAADFDVERGDLAGAVDRYRSLDSLQQVLLAAANPESGADRKTFTEQVASEDDPFERDEAGAGGAGRARGPGAWPWVVALLGLGWFAFALHNGSLRRALRIERGRVIRLRSLVPADRFGTAHPSTSDPADAKSVAAFLDSLDRDLVDSVDWTVPADFAEQLSADQQSAIRALLEGVAELPRTGSRIRAEITPSEAGWRLSLVGEGSGMSEAMRGLFSGQDTPTTGRWSAVQGSLRSLTARLTVERTADLRERVNVDFSPPRH